MMRWPLAKLTRESSGFAARPQILANLVVRDLTGAPDGVVVAAAFKHGQSSPAIHRLGAGGQQEKEQEDFHKTLLSADSNDAARLSLQIIAPRAASHIGGSHAFFWRWQLHADSSGLGKADGDGLPGRARPALSPAHVVKGFSHKFSRLSRG